MLEIFISTSYVTSYYLIPDRTNFSIDYYVDLVCKMLLCPKSAITKIEIKEFKS